MVTKRCVASAIQVYCVALSDFLINIFAGRDLSVIKKGKSAVCDYRVMDALGRFAKLSRSWSRTRLSPCATLHFFRA